MPETVTLLEGIDLRDTVYQYLLEHNFKRRVFKSKNQAIYWTIRTLFDTDWTMRYHPKFNRLDIFNLNGKLLGSIYFITVEIDENDYGF